MQVHENYGEMHLKWIQLTEFKSARNSLQIFRIS